MTEIVGGLYVREVLESRRAGLDDEDAKRRLGRREATGDDTASGTT